jgi:hypothetical protein
MPLSIVEHRACSKGGPARGTDELLMPCETALAVEYATYRHHFVSRHRPRGSRMQCRTWRV